MKITTIKELTKCIKWIGGTPYWINRKYNLNGNIAGTITDNGYRQICYTAKKEKKHERVLAHHLIWFMEYGYLPTMLDHKNRDKLDNNIKNLRLCNKSQNARNVVKKSKRSSSKYTGVHWCNKISKWVSRIRINYKMLYLGRYTCEHCAGLAYDQALIDNGLTEFGRFNLMVV